MDAALVQATCRGASLCLSASLLLGSWVYGDHRSTESTNYDCGSR
jgi:hypothetical protein